MLEYYKEELNDTLKKARMEMKKENFSFLFITDMHADFEDQAEVIWRQCEAVVELASAADVDCIVLGGDIIHGINSKEESIEYLKNYVRIFQNAKAPTFTARGNHDENPYHIADGLEWWMEGAYSKQRVPWKYIIYDHIWKKEILDPLTRQMAIHDEQKQDSTYYYVDFPEKKTRLIFLDAYDSPNEVNGEFAKYVSETWDKFSDRQLVWLAETALDVTKEDWNYIIVSHAALIDGGLEDIWAPCHNASDAMSMFEAFNHRRMYENECLNLKKDYTQAKSNISAHVMGHTHIDIYHYDENVRMSIIGTGAASVVNETIDESKVTINYCASPQREKGTITEALFDLIIFLPSGQISRIRFGAGEDL